MKLQIPLGNALFIYSLQKGFQCTMDASELLIALFTITLVKI